MDICNLALAHLGQRPTVVSIDPPEGSAEAALCARFFPVARDFLLEAHDWGFATTRIAVALGAVTTPPAWQYAYVQPNDCVRALAVLNPEDPHEDQRNPFIRETTPDGTVTLVYCNVANAVLRYTRRVTDPTRYSPLFVEGLSRVLASYLAGPLIKGDVGRKEGAEQMKAALAVVNSAQVSDARQIRTNINLDETRHRPSWIAGRGPGNA
ncbi:hypothetical protein [Asticcacaulis sp.]|uniref:hypothetical protein n=1 Tax=Asticcacaulis sp. TaxID=1872648 RepID=UPI0031DE6577